MLKVLGVTAPHYVQKQKNTKSTSLNSSDPFSLYNAYKVCADKAEKEDENWGDSNWNTKEGRDNSIMLLQHYYDDAPRFLEKLKEIKPNLLFIGSMSLGFAGAVEIAKLAKRALGDEVFVVLGGKHINETLYEENGEVKQLKSSPLELMKSNKIPKVFDMISSGDGEEILYHIGNAVNQSLKNKHNFDDVYNYDKFKEARGDWVLGWLDKDDGCQFVQSDKVPLDYDELPLTSELFNISTKFDVFENSDLTAHTMSYLSKGCVHNCFYCSESSKINGKLKQTETAAKRLYKNLESIKKVGKERYNSDQMSAFVEDSIILAGNPKLLNQLSELLQENPLDVEFGGQFTIDTLLDTENQKAISKLSKQGFSYIFVGLETNNEGIADTMSKNKNKNTLSWIEKNEKAIEFMKSQDMKYGVSVLFGLGENQKDRINLMKTIKSWQEKYGLPNVVSMNLAVQHPLRNNEDYDYIDWGTDINSNYLPIFTKIFGEASERYKLSGVELPTVEELQELQKYYNQIQEFKDKREAKISEEFEI